MDWLKKQQGLCELHAQVNLAPVLLIYTHKIVLRVIYIRKRTSGYDSIYEEYE